MEEDVSKKQKRLTESEWAEICALWEIGDVTLEVLSIKYGISRDALFRGLKRRDVQKGSKAGEHRTAVRDKVMEEAATNVNELARRIKDTKDDYYRHADMATKIAMNEMVKAAKTGASISTCNPTFDALKNLMNILKAGLDIRWKVLELDKDGVSEDDLPELVIRELTGDEIEQIQNFQISGDENLLEQEESDVMPDDEYDGDYVEGMDEDDDNE